MYRLKQGKPFINLTSEQKEDLNEAIQKYGQCNIRGIGTIKLSIKEDVPYYDIMKKKMDKGKHVRMSFTPNPAWKKKFN